MTTSSDLAETWIRLSSVRSDSVPPSRDCSIVIRFELAISVERKRARSVIRDDPDSASAPIDPPPVVPMIRTFELVRLLRLTSPTAAVTHTLLPACTAERTCAAVVAVVAPATQDGVPSGGSSGSGGGVGVGVGVDVGDGVGVDVGVGVGVDVGVGVGVDVGVGVGVDVGVGVGVVGAARCRTRDRERGRRRQRARLAQRRRRQDQRQR